MMQGKIPKGERDHRTDHIITITPGNEKASDQNTITLLIAGSAASR